MAAIMSKMELYAEWTVMPIGVNQAISSWIGEISAPQALSVCLSGYLATATAGLTSLGDGLDHGILAGTSGLGNQVQALIPLGDEKIFSIFGSLGTSGVFKTLIGMGLEKAGKILLQVGTFETSVQSLRGQLMHGDGAGLSQAVVTGLVTEARQVQAIMLESSNALSGVQKVLSILMRGDGASAQQAVVSELINDIQKNQSLSVELSDALAGLQSLKMMLAQGDGASAQQSVISALLANISNVASLRMELSDSLSNFQKNITSLSGDPVMGFQSLIISLITTNDVWAIQSLLTALNDLSASYYTVSAEIYLDGRPLSMRVINPITITYNESNVHNQITFSSADQELFAWCDPEFMPGTARIEAQIGSRMMQFIILAREGESIDFTVTGISVSDLEDGFADDIAYSLIVPTLASEIAAALTNYCPVDWRVEDWVVPVDFSFSGKPLDGIQTLAAEVGAIVRCADDGSLIVRNKRPVRPVDMSNAAPAVSYDETMVIALSHSETESSGYNAVMVDGRPQEFEAPILELEEFDDGHTPKPGETVRVRVYWGGMDPEVLSTYVTAGEIQLLNNGLVASQTETDIVVEFKDRKGSVRYPITNLISYEWEGYPASEITYNKNGNELFITSPEFAVARIKYQTEYQRYEISHHYVDLLIAVLFLAATPSVAVDVQTEDTPKYGSAISAPLLTTNATAVARGTAWIDENKYRKSNLSVTAPYLDAALDGVVAYLHDARIGSPGNYHIKSSDVIIDGPMVTNVMELEQCLI